jgi:hypothetical protein
MDLSQLAKELFAIRKTLIPGTWVPTYDADGKETARKNECRFLADHSEIDRLRLVLTIRRGSLSNVTLHADLTQPNVRTTWHVFRLDVGQPSQHSNKVKEGHPLSGRLFPPGSTHEHHFSDSIVPGHCDFASQPTEKITNFDEAFRYFCAKMNVVGGEALPAPSGQAVLI